jgi:hypothetical protein
MLNDTKHQLFAVYTYGYLEVYFQYYMTRPPFDSKPLRLELVEKLNRVPGVAISPDAIARRPKISLESVADNSSIVNLLSVFDWVVSMLQSAAAA